MADVTAKLAEALRLISFASMDRGARDTATEALRLYDAAKAQPVQDERAAFEAWFSTFRHGWKTERDVAFDAFKAGRAALAATPAPAEPVAWLTPDGKLMRHDPSETEEYHNVPRSTPLYAAPQAATPAPEPQPVQDLPPLPPVDYDAGWHRQYTAEQMRDYARAALAATPAPAPQDAKEQCSYCRHPLFAATKCHSCGYEPVQAATPAPAKPVCQSCGDPDAPWSAKRLDGTQDTFCNECRPGDAMKLAATPAPAPQPDNPWRASLENCISGDNYLRASEYSELIKELDDLYRMRASTGGKP